MLFSRFLFQIFPSSSSWEVEGAICHHWLRSKSLGSSLGLHWHCLGWRGKPAPGLLLLLGSYGGEGVEVHTPHLFSDDAAWDWEHQQYSAEVDWILSKRFLISPFHSPLLRENRFSHGAFPTPVCVGGSGSHASPKHSLAYIEDKIWWTLGGVPQIIRSLVHFPLSTFRVLSSLSVIL